MVDKRLEVYFEDACEILDSLNIEYGNITDVTVNTKRKSIWGLCRYDKMEDSFSIQINYVLLDNSVDYEVVMNTMIHEVLHCHKDRMCHTGEWKRCANIINNKFGYQIKRTTSAAEKNIETDDTPVKYIVSCDGCGNVTKYKRKTKIVKILLKTPVGTCRCSLCGSNSFTVNNCGL